jgi:hypothetical protein
MIMRLLQRWSKQLHPSNAVLALAKYSLCGMYGRMPDYRIPQLSEAQLERKRALCEETIQLLNVLDAGCSTRRGERGSLSVHHNIGLWVLLRWRIR